MKVKFRQAVAGPDFVAQAGVTIELDDEVAAAFVEADPPLADEVGSDDKPVEREPKVEAGKSDKAKKGK
jgi:hypothetical protein